MHMGEMSAWQQDHSHPPTHISLHSVKKNLDSDQGPHLRLLWEPITVTPDHT